MAGILDQQTQTQIPVQNYMPPQPMYNPAMFAQNMTPYNMPNFGQGVSQFLTGNMAIPMQFGVDIPAYESTPFAPGDFMAFINAQKSGANTKKTTPISIPVFNPSTGSYTSVQVPGVPKG